MSMCCKDSVFITKFQAYQGMKSQNSKVFKRIYHKNPRFSSEFITKFQGFQAGLSQNSKVLWSGITKFRIISLGNAFGRLVGYYFCRVPFAVAALAGSCATACAATHHHLFLVEVV